ncbi:MAG: cobalt ECF transporter T component CbiQ [Lachnospiraceae bacterium]|nr:cobalt ECF transporter T component CbiQ [Lachnospiraceae bacterium]
MSKINNAIYEIHAIDALASKDRWVNRIHPLVKLIITVVYILAVVSFPKYDVIGLAGMVIYPIAVFMLSELSFWDSLRRLRVVLPFVCLIGILNPLLDKNTVLIAGTEISAGVLSMITLIIKGIFSVLASYLLIATTSIEKLCYALRLLHIPKVMITQFLLTYRYITVLLEEVNRITQAYSLRAPGQKGVQFKVWGSLTGQLLLRSMDRANNVYENMLLRGYQGDFMHMRERIAFRWHDMIYFLFWASMILLFRMYPVMWIIGNLIGGMLA